MHRIQRVPAGERRGRVHSSTVTVSVLEGQSHAKTKIEEKDLRFRWFSGTGPGGQNRNKVQCCLELTHIPTGLSQSAHSRSREDNEKNARSALEAKLETLSAGLHHDKINQKRNEQIGSGTRGERRRLYRFQDGKVLDYGTNKSMRLRDFMRGMVDGLWPS